MNRQEVLARLSALYVKNGTDRYGSMDDGTALQFPQTPIHPSNWPWLRAKYGPPEQQPIINKIVRAKMGRGTLAIDHKSNQHKKWKPNTRNQFDGPFDQTDPYKIGGRLGVPKDLPPISSYISPNPPQLGHLFKKDR